MENQAQGVELKLNDLKNLCAIVDTAVRRGAFSAAEISAVGSVYDRVNAFLVSVTPEEATPEVASETPKEPQA